jgi:RsiW-degrading membrane proteinase PrsW (M82 family)
MNARARWVCAGATGVAGVAAVTVALVLAERTPAVVFVIAAAAAPVTIALAMWARVGGTIPVRALVGGATIGPAVALLSHAAVAAFAAAFFLGFADAGRELLHHLRVDPTIAAVLSSPWVVLALVECAVVAPITEEAGKYLGSTLERPGSRPEAFMAGVAAGTGFAVVENIAYGAAAVIAGGPWVALAIVRATGAAVHPLATGLVSLAAWDGRRSARPSLRRALWGVAVHAIWNGSLVALLVARTAAGEGALLANGDVATMAFAAALGVVAAAVLWTVASSVRAGRDPFTMAIPTHARSLAAAIILAASLLVPVGVLVLAFPAFRQ